MLTGFLHDQRIIKQSNPLHCQEDIYNIYSDTVLQSKSALHIQLGLLVIINLIKYKWLLFLCDC